MTVYLADLTRKYMNKLREAQGLMPSEEQIDADLMEGLARNVLGASWHSRKDEDEAAYLKTPEDCPSCGSTKGKTIWDSHWESISPTRGFIQAQCRGCGATWEDHYRLIGYERLEEEREN